MAHLFQVGVGSGGMVVLDLLSRDDRIDKITIVDPDIYKPHNVVRHYFPPSAVGRLKVDLAAEWLRERRPNLTVDTWAVDLMESSAQDRWLEILRSVDLGICAVDHEPAKYHFDLLMRQSSKPWTLGEVLSGGIGGWIHHFEPEGPCYGCVASHLQREIVTDRTPAPDYTDPQAVRQETSIPASKASIETIASMHALISLQQLKKEDPGFTSLLWSLARVDGVFPEPYRPYRFSMVRSPECLICRVLPETRTGEELDVALDQALARLDYE